MAPSLLAYHSLGSCFSQQVVLVVAFGHREYIILPTHQDLLKVLFLLLAYVILISLPRTHISFQSQPAYLLELGNNLVIWFGYFFQSLQ